MSPGHLQRMQQLAFPWHNYGNPIIGQRADIERVPIDKLQAFYRTWYQPDNAVLILAGRFDEKQARPMGRATRGTRGIDLRGDDFVVSLCPVSSDDSERMLSVSEQGYGKQTPISTYRLQSRGGKGVINMKTTDKTGKVVAVFPVDDESEIMIITQQAKLIRLEAGDIRKTGRSAQGVRLIKTEEGDKDFRICDARRVEEDGRKRGRDAHADRRGSSDKGMQQKRKTDDAQPGEHGKHAGGNVGHAEEQIGCRLAEQHDRRGIIERHPGRQRSAIEE